MVRKIKKPVEESADEKFQRAFDSLQQQDSGYADNLRAEVSHWGREGVYNALAREVSLDPGELHVDLGAGMMNLVNSIQRQNPEAVVLGVERNTSVVSSALALFRALGIDPKICHSEFFCVDTRGRIRTVYDREDVVRARGDLVDSQQLQFRSMLPYLAPIDDSFLTPDQTIKIAIDDLREMRVVSRLLGDRKIDSASITFPGSGERPAFEAPHDFPKRGKSVPDAVAIPRMHEAVHQAITSGLAYLTERVRKGGELLLAERLMDTGTDDFMVGSLVAMIRDRFGKHFDSWDLRSVGLTQVVKKPAGLAWDLVAKRGGDVSGVKVDPEGKFRIGVVKLQRK